MPIGNCYFKKQLGEGIGRAEGWWVQWHRVFYRYFKCTLRWVCQGACVGLGGLVWMNMSCSHWPVAPVLGLQVAPVGESTPCHGSTAAQNCGPGERRGWSSVAGRGTWVQCGDAGAHQNKNYLFYLKSTLQRKKKLLIPVLLWKLTLIV